MRRSATAVTRDPELRRLLRRRLERQYAGDDATVICDELSVCRARARIDLAVINGSLVGYEIKSGADRLDRLRSQASQYNRVFDRVTVVCAPRHAEVVTAYLPDWYGVWVADPFAAEPLSPVRVSNPNPAPSTRARAGLLWREEMLTVLAAVGCDRGMRAKTRRTLIDALLANLSQKAVAYAVREQLRQRLRAASTVRHH